VIIDKLKKLGVFPVPKTGTSTLFRLFKSYNNNCVQATVSHNNWTLIEKINRSEHDNFHGYRFFAFYREPIDRFGSAVSYIKRIMYRETLQYFYDDLTMSCARVDPYETLEPELKEKIERICPFDLLHHPMLSKSPTFEKQVYWLDHPIDITYLNYHDYENEVKRLLNEFQLPIVNIPRHNQSVSVEGADILSESDIAYLKDYYRADYEFFANKGITFSNTPT
jgi:hypothetical protein